MTTPVPCVTSPATCPTTGRWPLRLYRAWVNASTWRQLGYHALALPLLTGGVALVVVCSVGSVH